MIGAITVACSRGFRACAAHVQFGCNIAEIPYAGIHR